MRPLHPIALLVMGAILFNVCSARGASQTIKTSTNIVKSNSDRLKQQSSIGSCQGLAERVDELADGFQYTEGPAWDKRRGRWMFSDVTGDTVYGITPDGALTRIRTQAGFPNGRAFRDDGKVVVAQHDRTLNLVEGDGTNFTRLIDSYKGKKLNSPNDVSIAKDGSTYFTDPMFGIQGYGPEKAESELGYAGIYKLVNGQLSLLNKDLATPNGIAITNDQRTLIVSDTSTDQLFSIDLTSFSGKPVAATLLTTLNKLNDGGDGHGPDGLKIAADGSIWATGKGGIHVLEADGTFKCGIPFPNHVANLAFGGNNNEFILVTAGNKVYKITLR